MASARAFSSARAMGLEGSRAQCWLGMRLEPTRASATMESMEGRIPEEFQRVMLDFTVQYLLEQPADLRTFGMAFFAAMPHDDDASIPNEDSMASTPVKTEYAKSCGRRKSVFAEAYDPEEEDDDDDCQQVVHPKSDAQRRRLQESVQNILLFRSLDSSQLSEVLDAMFERRVAPGEEVIAQGDDGDNFYVIESGVYNIYVDSDGGSANHVGSYAHEGSFGELALLYNMPRAATITAATSGTLWALDRFTFRKIVLRSTFQRRKMYEALLESVPMLNSLSEYERMNLADALVSKSYGDKEVIVKQGEPADGMYFVEEGRVAIAVANDGNEREITSIDKGGYFGELALVTHKPRAATATARGKVKLAFLDVLAFERLLGPCMDVLKRNIRDYEQQLLAVFGSKANISDIR